MNMLVCALKWLIGRPRAFYRAMGGKDFNEAIDGAAACLSDDVGGDARLPSRGEFTRLAKEVHSASVRRSTMLGLLGLAGFAVTGHLSIRATDATMRIFEQEQRARDIERLAIQEPILWPTSSSKLDGGNDHVMPQVTPKARLRAYLELREVYTRLHGSVSRIYFEGARLDEVMARGVDFSDAKLFRASLRESDLEGASFKGADLEETDLSGVELRGTDFRGAVLVAASLKDANNDWRAYVPRLGVGLVDMSTAPRRAPRTLRERPPDKLVDGSRQLMAATDFTGARFARADLGGAYLIGVNMKGADFTFANLTDTDLTDADLNGAAGLEDSYGAPTWDPWPPRGVPRGILERWFFGLDARASDGELAALKAREGSSRDD